MECSGAQEKPNPGSSARLATAAGSDCSEANKETPNLIMFSACQSIVNEPIGSG